MIIARLTSTTFHCESGNSGNESLRLASRIGQRFGDLVPHKAVVGCPGRGQGQRTRTGGPGRSWEDPWRTSCSKQAGQANSCFWPSFENVGGADGHEAEPEADAELLLRLTAVDTDKISRDTKRSCRRCRLHSSRCRAASSCVSREVATALASHILITR